MSTTLNATPEAPENTLTVPEQGGDVGDWGTKLNSALQKLLNWTAQLDDGKVENAGAVPAIRVGAADSTDASGNPTPDTVAFPPANYPLGTLFYATSYPAAVADGQMTFRRVGAVGSEAWAWFRGSFRASNSNGDYVRSADGTQECWHGVSPTLDMDATGAGGYRNWGGAAAWTFPVAFAATAKVDGTSTNVNALFFNAPGGTTSTDLFWWRATSALGVAVGAHLTAIGRWK
jgi:hypothetical protein